MTSSLEAQGVFLNLGGSPILEDVHFCLEQGKVAVLLGPSGVGKSSLLRVLAGLLEPSRGSVAIRNQQGHREDGHVRSRGAWMPQQDLLLPWASVLQNALPPLERDKAEQAHVRQEARELLHCLGLAGWESRLPYELSQGMRQRVALVRTLMMKRPFMLLDEPCSALDVDTRQKVLALISQRCASHGCGVVMVSHHASDAELLGAPAWVLEGGHLCPV
jgi:putative hydroxymethylpyrimidine transport system ATP-binding protein